MKVVVSLLLFGLPAMLAAPKPVSQWSVEEIVLEARSEHDRPYAQDLLRADFRGPAEEKVAVRGFWDGGKTWKIRWAPTSAGRWTYRTESPDPGLNGATGEYEVSAAKSGTHGFLRRDIEYPYTLIYDDGTRYFLFGNTYYALVASYLGNGDGSKRSITRGRPG